MRKDINVIISRDERHLIPRNTLVEKLKKDYSYTAMPESYKAFENALSELRNKQDSTGVKMLLKSDVPIFTLAGKPCASKEFAAYIFGNAKTANNLNSSYSSFVNDKVLAYEDSQLEKKYPEFGHLVQEYHDGILLFEISNREVWDKATKDTVGLEKYFAKHKLDYAWDKPRFKGFAISCADKDVASRVKRMIKNLPADSIATVLKKTFNTDTTTVVKVERGLFVQGENPVVDLQVFKQKDVKTGDELPVSLVKGKVLKDGPDYYTDVRGLVISDYQNYLEKNWVSQLRKKYVVKINEQVINTVNKD
jgi:peptidyl-prolyl cis-trans isomerase SurA